MNPDSPKNKREALEARLTSLLLGELSHEEAASLHQELSRDPELSKLYDRLKETIGVVRETMHAPAEHNIEPAERPKLSDERRQKLLAHFKTVAPSEFEKPKGRATRVILELAIAASIVVILGGLMLPALSKAKAKAKAQRTAEFNEARLVEKSVPSDSVYAKRRAEYAARTSVAGKPDSSGTVYPLGAAGYYSRSITPSAAIDREQAATDKPPVASPPPPMGMDDGRKISAGSFTLSDSSLQQRSAIVLPTVEPSTATAVAGSSLSGHLQTGASATPADIPRGEAQSTAAPAAGQRSSDKPAGALKFRTWSLENSGDLPQITTAPKPAAGTPDSTHLNWSDELRTGGQKRHDGYTFGLADAGVSSATAPSSTLQPARTSGEVGKGPASDFSEDKAFSDDVASTGQATMFGRYAYKTPAADTSVFDLSEANKQIGQFSGGQPKENTRALSTPMEGKTPNGAGSPAGRVPLLGDVATGHAFKSESTVQKSEPLDETVEDAERLAKNSALAEVAAGDGGGARPKRQLSYHDLEGQSTGSSSANEQQWNGYWVSSTHGAVLSSSGASPNTSFDVESFNAIVQPSKAPEDTRGAFVKSLTNSRVAAGHGEGSSNAAQLFAYQNAKEDLEQKKRYSQILDMKIAGEKIDADLPKSTMVEIVDRAVPPTQKSASPSPKPPANPLIPQPEIQTADNACSTFSLNVSDVAFKLAAASLEKGETPDGGSMRSEEFINAFDYRDPEPQPGVAVAFASERAQYPFAQNRDLLRFSVKTAALGRAPGKPLNLVLLLDNSGSMERADRVQIIREALRVLAGQFQPQDKLSIVTFARTAQLRVDGVPGSRATNAVEQVAGLTPEGGTNLEEAMKLAYATALRHYLANGVNRVVLLTDGAANLGDVSPASLKQQVETHRKQGVALDCFGIGWEGYNDDLLEELSRNGDGRYGFINTPAAAATEFAGQLAGALHVAASDVKVQVEFNPKRVTSWRQIGYAKHQLTKEQFRDNTVDAAEIGAAESGNALYVIEVNPKGEGPIATVRARYKTPGTEDYREHEWPVAYSGRALPLDQSSSAMRLAATAGAFSEWLAASPYAGEITPDRLIGYLNGVPEKYGADPRPKQLEWMIRQAKRLTGK